MTVQVRLVALFPIVQGICTVQLSRAAAVQIVCSGAGLSSNCHHHLSQAGFGSRPSFTASPEQPMGETRKLVLLLIKLGISTARLWVGARTAILVKRAAE